MRALKSIDKALFGWGSPVVFGVVRMVTGALALLNFLMIAIDFDAWFTERGFIPLWHAKKWGMLPPESWWHGEVPRINLLVDVTDGRVTALVYAACCVACLLTMIGLWTRLSSIAMFVLIVTLHHRAPDLLHSGDTLLRQMAFLVMIAPSGAACSLDRLFALWKGRASRVPELVSLWPQRMMQFQVTVVYFTSVWHKWSGSHWRDGTATWFVPQLHEFDRFPVPPFFDQQPFVMATTYATLIIELSVAFLAYAKPLRKWVLLAGVVLHAGIEYRFNIPLFSFMMCSTYLAFFDGEEFSAFAKRLGAKMKKHHLTVFLPAGTVLSERGYATLNALDFLGLVEYRSGAGEGWRAEKPDGTVVDASRAILKRCPPAWLYFLAPRRWSAKLNQALGTGADPLPVDRERETVIS